MDDLLSIGQWQGFYQYGPEYGELLENKEVEFRLFIEEYMEGRFRGRAIDWDGVGANGEVSLVEGFFSNGIISFTKQYPHYQAIDAWGNCESDEHLPGHTVTYEGVFDPQSNSFNGSWEIVVDEEHEADSIIQEITTGTWRMSMQS